MARLTDRLYAAWVPEGATFGEALRAWIQQDGYWYLTSATVHAIGFVIFAIIAAFLPALGSTLGSAFSGAAPTLESPPPDKVVEDFPERFDMGEAPLEPTKIDLDALTPAPPAAQDARFYDDSDEFEEAGGGSRSELDQPLLGGMGGFRVEGLAGIGGLGGVGISSGEGDTAGVGGEGGSGFGGRGKGHREKIIGTLGGTKASERAVAGGLHWLASHQLRSGGWSLQHNTACKGHGCNGAGTFKSDAAATALALLPFLGAGQTHRTAGMYQKVVQNGVSWLIKHQTEDGDLSANSIQRMYAHGLATLALCEAYGLSKDPAVGRAAAKAIRFIERAQNESTGAWRYEPGEEGDTSVTGWQVMALKSAHMADLGVNSLTLENTRKWLALVHSGEHNGLYQYRPYDSKGVTPTMTAVGMLMTQYLGMTRDDPVMLEGQRYLMKNLPDVDTQRNIYYWYYATMVMRNLVGPDWDTWNRKVRRALIKSQINNPESCANGSWDLDRPSNETNYGYAGGRLMVTSLSVLTLEVYYRYLPIYKINLPPPAGKGQSPFNLAGQR